ncbi:MAG TPA: hypothetical protein GXX37_02165 [Clostridiaceae bacterium]|nr:hypothetical protein [Clostridiaceae bacterium]
MKIYSYYAELYSYKEYIRSLIKNEGINVNLEDIFTSFDKSILSREHIHKYTYTQMDEIRFSIMRLFIYYFSKSVQEHSFKQEDYIHFFKFIKKQKTKSPTTIITTNWDTLIEEYCERNKIKYDYGFKIPYTNMHDNACESDIILLKIHGSANWLRCLHCGAFLVFKKGEAAKSLFEDGKNETCTVCGQGESFNAPSLQPEIITPTMLKSFANCLYLNIWSAASKALREATEVIFIGYSFPIADFDFRYMLQKSISTKARIDVVLHENDNPEQTESKNLQSLFPEKRYRDAFPKNTLRFFYNGFSDYFSCYSS